MSAVLALFGNLTASRLIAGTVLIPTSNRMNNLSALGANSAGATADLQSYATVAPAVLLF